MYALRRITSEFASAASNPRYFVTYLVPDFGRVGDVVDCEPFCGVVESDKEISWDGIFQYLIVL